MRPILHELFDALEARGWTLTTTGNQVSFIDPEGNHWHHIEDAITAQSLREVTESEQA